METVEISNNDVFLFLDGDGMNVELLLRWTVAVCDGELPRREDDLGVDEFQVCTWLIWMAGMLFFMRVSIPPLCPVGLSRRNAS
jgi:hypothetical protein